MVASNSTLDNVLRVVLKHVDEETAKKIITDLLEVQGNKSFRDSISNLAGKLPKKDMYNVT